MRELLKQWKRENPDYLTEYNEYALKFLSIIEEIQDFNIFNDVQKIYFVFYGDMGNEHMLELYYDRDDSDYYVMVVLEGYDNGAFGLQTLDYTKDGNKIYFIPDREIFMKILADTNDFSDLKIPHDIANVKISRDTAKKWTDDETWIYITRKIDQS